MKIEHSKYDAWLLDLDGTLYRAKPVQLLMGAELALQGLAAVSTLRSFRNCHEKLRVLAADATKNPFQRQLELAAGELGVSVAEVEARVREWMVARPSKWLRLFLRSSLLDQVRRFRAAGGRTAVVSDYPAREKLRRTGIADLFDTVVAAGEPDGPPRLKPDPSGYLMAAERLGVSHTRCLIIGDRMDADGGAAKAAGIDCRIVGIFD